jgi:hypothetical protein
MRYFSEKYGSTHAPCRRLALGTLIILILASFQVQRSTAQDQSRQRVFEYAVRSAEGTFDEVASLLADSLVSGGWEMVAAVDAGVPDECPYRARVFVLYDAQYSSDLMAANERTAPFAAWNRVNLFEDEAGLHVSVVNPRSINRTVMLDDASQVGAAQAMLDRLRATIVDAVSGTPSSEGYGQERRRGLIGKTMGVMAGGPFDGRVGDVASFPGEEVGVVAARLRRAFSEPGSKWGIHLVGETRLDDTVILAITGSPLDSDSFSIVKAGSDRARKRMQCPGIAHAAAYPLELVVTRSGDATVVRTAASMYRMKMYFEDAGKWAFMKNMGMPGSIASEIEDKVTGN